MAQLQHPLLTGFQRRLALYLTGPPALAFLPCISLASYWFGGEGALIVVSALLPLIYLAAGAVHEQQTTADRYGDVLPRATFDTRVAQVFERCAKGIEEANLLFVGLEDFDVLAERYGQSTADLVRQRTADRLIAVLRDADLIGEIAEARFAVCTAPMRKLDLETCIQLAARLQAAVEEPVSVDGTVVYLTASVGFCQHARAPGRTATDWIEAATIALREAHRHGPTAIRAFNEDMYRAQKTRSNLREEAAIALDTGQIQPWFQPQISTDTGEITGFEALARWNHPERGMISPADFLPALEESALLERLAEVMMYHSFAALKAWDGAGVNVPQVGVNFAGSELNNPRLLEKIKWELDRFDLSPDRLAVEVLETVVAKAPDDMITRNINALGELGCRIDLDDFGTGHASIASIRRFSVGRIKIDRSFVMKADRDPEQQRMIGAILTMAERLGIETLAEGVETVGEHVLLAQLGCDHVQGFGIARPMPFEQTLDWLARHGEKLQDMPRIMGGKDG
ncbi:putative bifunctional diguanylate cyclase/phosphodiesterase [Sulfitobacter sp. JB4-11]|uniref:putative bifunctional diguanylate cyclase/phosphodiesterase n=1 Tax=Sulfitobacter rhodophyticola TaxID=3238304 RepID=UPI0035167D22